MTKAEKSYRLELTKEQRALVLQKTGMEAEELELTADELKTRAEPSSSSTRPVVLVVDDEPVALAVLQRTLEPHYQVLTASDGLEALDIIKARGSVVRVVVSDVRMPRLSGPALAAHLARLDHAPAILFVSAYTDPDLPWDVLAKPFRPDALLGAVSRLLESQDQSANRLP